MLTDSAGKEKILVFSQWKKALDRMEISLLDAKIDYSRLDGEMTTSKRIEEIQKFKTHNNVRVFLVR